MSKQRRRGAHRELAPPREEGAAGALPVSGRAATKAGLPGRRPRPARPPSSAGSCQPRPPRAAHQTPRPARGTQRVMSSPVLRALLRGDAVRMREAGRGAGLLFFLVPLKKGKGREGKEARPGRGRRCWEVPGGPCATASAGWAGRGGAGEGARPAAASASALAPGWPVGVGPRSLCPVGRAHVWSQEAWAASGHVDPLGLRPGPPGRLLKEGGRAQWEVGARGPPSLPWAPQQAALSWDPLGKPVWGTAPSGAAGDHGNPVASSGRVGGVTPAGTQTGTQGACQARSWLAGAVRARPAA